MSIRRLFRHMRRNRELEEEIKAHLAMATGDRMEQGEDPRAAKAAVQREFGNRTLVEEVTREQWGWSFLQALWQDVQYAWRGLRRSPGFTVAAILTLALGIGANTAIFSLMNTVMLRALAVQQPEQLVELLQKYPNEPRGNGYWTSKSYEHLRDHNHVFSVLTGTAIDNHLSLRAQGSQPEYGVGEYVLDNYFSSLGIKPALGRLIGPDDNAANEAGAIAVVSWSYWERRFNRDPQVLGKQIVVQGVPTVIIGVAPRSYTGLRIDASTDVWLPRKSTSPTKLTLLARLKHGVTMEQARADMDVLYRFTIDERSVGSPDPQTRQLRMELEPARAGLSTVRDRWGKPLLTLMAVVGMLLLIACANITSLLLARAAGRGREMALRVGLGASRGRLIRQALTESLLLSLLGAFASVLVAYAGTSAMVRVLASGRVHEQIHLQVQPDVRVLLFTAAVAILSGLLFGLAPAWNAFRFDPANALRQTGATSEAGVRNLSGRVLVAVQVALSVVLLGSGGLFVAHLSNLENKDLGFQRDRVLLVAVDQPPGVDMPRSAGAYREILRRLSAMPGVRSVALGAPTPLSGAGANGFANVEGYQENPKDRRWISIGYVSPKYFETLGMPLLAGRDFTFQDHAPIAIISQKIARHYFGKSNPLGKHVTLFHVTGEKREQMFEYEIVGVAGDANYHEIREPEKRTIYLPAFRNDRVGADNFILRTSVKPESIAGDVRGILASVLTNAPVTRMTTLSDQIDATIIPERLIAKLAGFFAVLGGLLAGVGLYGLLAYTVSRRTREIGIRLALGATTASVVGMVVRDALAVVVIGLIIGCPLTIWGRALAGHLIDDLTVPSVTPLLVGATMIVVVAFVASYVPARRASHVNPTEALRHE